MLASGELISPGTYLKEADESVLITQCGLNSVDIVQVHKIGSDAYFAPNHQTLSLETVNTYQIMNDKNLSLKKRADLTRMAALSEASKGTGNILPKSLQLLQALEVH